jgi:hypothetical protein
MPAITLTLPRIFASPRRHRLVPLDRSGRPPPAHGLRGRQIPVVRACAGVSAAALDPIVHMDQMGEIEY